MLSIYKQDEKRLKYQANSKTQRNKWPSKHRSGTQDHPGIPRPSQSTSSTDPGHPSTSPSPAQPQAFLGAAAGFTTLLAMHLLVSVAETDLDLRGVARWVSTGDMARGARYQCFGLGESSRNMVISCVQLWDLWAQINWDTNHVQPTRNDVINQVKEGRDFKLADSKLHMFILKSHRQRLHRSSLFQPRHPRVWSWVELSGCPFASSASF